MLSQAQAFAAILAALVPFGSAAQVGCVPPEEPYVFEPPRDDPELRALINEQYETYLFGIEDYLNCLHAESNRAAAEARVVIERWVGHFGDEAALRLRQSDRDGRD